LTEDLAGSVEQILWRDLRPVVVVVDSCSFGAELPSEEGEVGFASLQSRNVPVVIVRRGDSLKAVLEAGFSKSYVSEWGPAYDVKNKI
jgi:hypothetical protein